MATATIYPQAEFSWETPQLDFAGSVASFTLADLAAAVFDFAPWLFTFEPGGVQPDFLTADGEVLTSDGDELTW